MFVRKARKTLEALPKKPCNFHFAHFILNVVSVSLWFGEGETIG